MSSNEGFRPDWVSPPGATVIDILQSKEISLADLAQRLEWSPLAVDRFLVGKAELTPTNAIQLERALGPSASFWLDREQQFRADLARLAEEEPEESQVRWLRDLPLGDMLKFGWIPRSSSSAEQARSCLDFFAVSSVAQWRQQVASLGTATFRTSFAFQSVDASVAAWLRQGERIASAMICSQWDKEVLRASIPSLRELTRQNDPAKFLPELQGICSQAGVAMVVARSPSGCRASGATRFLSQDKVLILFSFRHLSDDQFWFTFFHEIGHLLLHSDRMTFIEGISSGEQENEANDFASATLIPNDHVERMRKLPHRAKEIMRFARQVGVSAGIVVGQMQYRGVLQYDQMNKLKRRFRWA